MIQINKVGNAIVIKFTDNDKYLFNGTIEVAPNELMVVVDQSNMVTFKKMSNGDTLFGQSYEKIRINDEPVTKENIVEKFATIGFTSGGGGGTGGAVDSVNGQTGTVIITAASIGAMTKETADATYQPIGDYAVKSDLSTLATKAELNNKLDTSVYEVDKPTFALKSELSDLVTTEQLNTKQDTLVSGTNIKTINGQTLLGEGNIEIQGGSGGISDAPSDNKLYGRKNGNWSEVPSTDNFATKQEISDMLTKSEAASTYQPKGEYLTSIPEEYVTDSELSAKGYATTSQLSSKLDVSTYNSEKANFATKDELNSKADTSAIADMATQTWVQGQGYLTEVPSNYVTDSELTEALANKQDKGDYALKSDLNNLATKEELAAKADASALSAKQDTLVSGTNIKTINGETILGEGDIVIQAGGTVDTAMSDTSENAVQNKVIKKYIDDLVGNILTQLQEINGTN